MLKQIQGEEIHFQCSHLITAEPSITHLQNKLSSNIKEEGEIPWKKTPIINLNKETGDDCLLKSYLHIIWSY